jgi:MFS family permease
MCEAGLRIGEGYGSPRDDPNEHPDITPRKLERVPSYAARKQREKEAVPWLVLARRMLPVTGVYFCYGWTLWLYLAWKPSFFLHSYRLNLKSSALPTILLNNLTWVAVFLSLAFFFSEFTIGPMWAIPMDIAPRFSGSASGLMNTGSALAAIVSPLVFGYVIDKTGDWTLPFLGSIGLLLIGAMLAFWMKPDEELPGAALTVMLAAKEAKL